MFDASVSFAITHIPGIRNMIFGADGVFLGALGGPGRVWLQSLPLPNLAHALTPYLPQPHDPQQAGPGGMLGGIAGSIFGNQ